MLLRITLAVLVLSIFAALSEARADRFGVTFVPGPESRTQIEKAPQAEGIALVDYVHNTSHAVLLVRRTTPGRAEVHASLTDVWYVVDGSGTLVTGGKPADVKAIGPGELRGSRISGGIARHIRKGDIIDIPAGVAHWVSKIDDKELVYLTVKVATAKR